VVELYLHTRISLHGIMLNCIMKYREDLRVRCVLCRLCGFQGKRNIDAIINKFKLWQIVVFVTLAKYKINF
jgi:hypothetical protein